MDHADALRILKSIKCPVLIVGEFDSSAVLHTNYGCSPTGVKTLTQETPAWSMRGVCPECTKGFPAYNVLHQAKKYLPLFKGFKLTAEDAATVALKTGYLLQARQTLRPSHDATQGKRFISWVKTWETRIEEELEKLRPLQDAEVKAAAELGVLAADSEALQKELEKSRETILDPCGQLQESEMLTKLRYAWKSAYLEFPQDPLKRRSEIRKKIQFPQGASFSEIPADTAVPREAGEPIRKWLERVVDFERPRVIDGVDQKLSSFIEERYNRSDATWFVYLTKDGLRNHDNPLLFSLASFGVEREGFLVPVRDETSLALFDQGFFVSEGSGENLNRVIETFEKLSPTLTSTLLSTAFELEKNN